MSEKVPVIMVPSAKTLTFSLHYTARTSCSIARWSGGSPNIVSSATVGVVNMAPAMHKQASICILLGINLMPALVDLCHQEYIMMSFTTPVYSHSITLGLSPQFLPTRVWQVQRTLVHCSWFSLDVLWRSAWCQEWLPDTSLRCQFFPHTFSFLNSRFLLCVNVITKVIVTLTERFSVSIFRSG